MLVLPAANPSPIADVTWFADHAVSGLGYLLPSGVEPAVDAYGGPEFRLVRYRGTGGTGGGLLRLRLGWEPLDPALIAAAANRGLATAAVPFDSVVARLIRRLPVDGSVEAIGPWVNGLADGAQTLTVHLGLDPRTAELVHQLLDGGSDLLEMQVTATYHGLIRGLPWLVTVDRTALLDVLRLKLGDGPVTATAVAAAFLSLPQGSNGFLQVTGLDAELAVPSPELIAVETAWRAMDLLFDAALPGALEPTDGPDTVARYRLRAADPVGPARVTFDLVPPRQAQQTVWYAWSVSQFLTSLPPAVRGSLFPSVTQIEPFVTVSVPVVCDVPFDPRFLVGVQCDLRYTGSRGVPEFRTLRFPSGGPVQSVEVSYPALVSDLGLAVRLRSTLAPPAAGGWPRMVNSDYRSLAAPMVDIDRAATGLEFVRVAVDADVCAAAATIRVTLTGDTTVDLTAASPSVWVALPGLTAADPIAYEVTGIGPTGERLSIRSGQVAGRQLLIDAGDLQPLLLDTVTITLDPAAGTGFAFAAITLQLPDHPPTTRTLATDSPVRWAVVRGSIFGPLRYRYQLSLVPYDDQHRTLPIYTTDWIDAEGTALAVVPVRPSPAPTA